MKNIILSLALTCGVFTLNASDYSIDNFSYHISETIVECPEETLVKISFDLEIQDIITILEKQIAMVEMYSENLLIQGHSVNSSMHSDILLLELRDCVSEIKSLKEIRDRFKYYLVVMNKSLLE